MTGPRVAYAANGQAVVVFTREAGSARDVFVSRYSDSDADGGWSGEALLISFATNPDIVATSTGGFVVTATDSNSSALFARSCR